MVKEASGVGLPVIGTWHGGIHEIIDDNKTGFLVPERNVPCLSERMSCFINDPDLIKSFGKAGRLKMEQEYDLFGQVAKLEMHYERAINNSQ